MIALNYFLKTIKDLGSLKLLEKFLSTYYKLKTQIHLSLLFVLYDLRILDSHLSDTSFDKKYEEPKKNLTFFLG